jgi:hypothetical protein
LGSHHTPPPLSLASSGVWTLAAHPQDVPASVAAARQPPSTINGKSANEIPTLRNAVILNVPMPSTEDAQPHSSIALTPPATPPTIIFRRNVKFSSPHKSVRGSQMTSFSNPADILCIRTQSIFLDQNSDCPCGVVQSERILTTPKLVNTIEGA